LAWILGEQSGDPVRERLAAAQTVVASDLTLIECDRVLIRAVATGQMSEAHAADRHASLNQAAAHWILFRVDEEIVERARRPFPVEPIRTLDALHLASATVIRTLLPGLALLSLDERVRDCGKALGFSVLPEWT
jgi:predicted nucleic acid-binding protein